MQEKIDNLIGETVIVYRNISPTFRIKGRLDKIREIYNILSMDEEHHSYFRKSNIVNVITIDDINHIEVF